MVIPSTPGLSPSCSHLFESFPYLQPFNRLRLLFLFKNHPQFSLSCNTKRNSSCEALRSFPVSGNIITTTASSAPERNIGISDLPIQVFVLFPLHFLSGSPVPQVSPDNVHAILYAGYHASNNQVTPCTLLSRSRAPARFRYHKSYLRHFNDGSLSFISITNTITELCPDFFRTAQSLTLSVQHQYLESTAPQGGLTNMPEHLCR